MYQRTLFDEAQFNKLHSRPSAERILPEAADERDHSLGSFQIQNRRYLGNKYRLLDFISEIVLTKCGYVDSFCDLFAGTGVVGAHFNSSHTKVISNDFLKSNYVCLRSFLGITDYSPTRTAEKIEYLNELSGIHENYFSNHYGGTYFTQENAKKIGAIREEINQIAESSDEQSMLICSLLYATDKVANTVGHYDAFRKRLDSCRPIRLLVPEINHWYNRRNEVYDQDANLLIRQLSVDVLYLDPPYNSRQYSDAYHLLENLAEWKRPQVVGTGRKMNRSHIKSRYCRKGATWAFADLIHHADCKHILLSYNNTGDAKDGRSNARMRDCEILEILSSKGRVEVFEKRYKAFSAGKSNDSGNAERVFYCHVSG